ncbi:MULTISPECIES: prolyl aminopeptidase [Subtercola]|uniref:Proline iminopeptidase n=1 Tax=Subtercola vilae TaxID=2056433 RepID=A0A4T2C9I4_9MICO|nr:MULTISPECIES: prolyl aminopeptidase [Subtercola]MEA9986412.1 prolyl aminopeptidase [Subtercola sp. RTI3]TIH40342.1 prolyl aminopeptidase [Subtercola vilae]
MRTAYPEIDPYEIGFLPVGDGHELYWEASGNPHGKPVVFLHGGPGAGSSPAHRRLFDPALYRIILFDQRGCGLSLPHASTSPEHLATNTTWHLVADIETLREHLGIERWQVFGGSWGSTLGLAYAQTHPERVSELVLRGIFTLRKVELDWFYEGAARLILPDLWQKFLEPVLASDETLDDRGHFIRAYHRLLTNPDPGIHGPAAVAWSAWESQAITLLPRPDLLENYSEPGYALAFARIENHYFLNGGWLEEGQLIAGASALKGIPGAIIQGRYDLCTPALTAWDLHQAWPEAEFTMVPDAGHAFDEPGILDALLDATDRFARP